MMGDFVERVLATVSIASVLSCVSGCKELPGTSGEQGAAIGGLGGAATGAVIGGENHRLLGALLGGAAGAGGGYLIGANKDRLTGHDSSGAQAASQKAQDSPATAQQALQAKTADLNGDGFVTMDEVVAMKKAGLSDSQMLDRLRATGQVFELTSAQQDYLRSNGVDSTIINQMPELNRDERSRLGTPASSSPGSEVIGSPASTNSVSPPH